MINVPKRIRNLKPYVAGKTIAEVKEAYNIHKISKLASNENRLGCSPAVERAVMTSLNQVQDYPDPVSKDLKEALSEKLNVNPEEILVAAGSESVLSILCRALLDETSNIVTANATFVGIFVQAGVMGAQVKRVPVTDQFKFDTESMLKAIDKDTRMIYIANPNNPTGTYISKDEYVSFIERVPDHILIITDEAYYEYSNEVPDYPDALEYRKENIIVTRTFSKGYGLAGFRIGYAIGDPELINELMKCKLTFEPTSPAQSAALAALKDQSFLKKSVSMISREREKLYPFFEDQNASYIRSISNSVMMVCGSEDEAADVTQKMLERGVILRQLQAFGLPHCIRVTIGTEGEMDHFKSAFKQVSQ